MEVADTNQAWNITCVCRKKIQELRVITMISNGLIVMLSNGLIVMLSNGPITMQSNGFFRMLSNGFAKKTRALYQSALCCMGFIKKTKALHNISVMPMRLATEILAMHTHISDVCVTRQRRANLAQHISDAKGMYDRDTSLA